MAAEHDTRAFMPANAVLCVLQGHERRAKSLDIRRRQQVVEQEANDIAAAKATVEAPAHLEQLSPFAARQQQPVDGQASEGGQPRRHSEGSNAQPGL